MSARPTAFDDHLARTADDLRRRRVTTPIGHNTFALTASDMTKAGKPVLTGLAGLFSTSLDMLLVGRGQPNNSRKPARMLD